MSRTRDIPGQLLLLEEFTSQTRHLRVQLAMFKDQSLPASLHPSRRGEEGWADKAAADAVTFASWAKGSWG